MGLDPATVMFMLVPLARIPMPGAEIVAFDPATRRAFVTTGSDVHVFGLEDPSRPVGGGFIRLASGRADVTHLAIDPAGRGFAAICVVPTSFATRHGEVAILDLQTLGVVASIPVGHNPDSCAFSPDGRFLVVANEGQPEVLSGGVLVDPPGSVTVIDLRGIQSTAELAGIGESRVTTMLLRGEALDAALASQRPPRIHPGNAETPTLDLEPEYVVVPDSERAYVSLQENNAIAVVGLDPPRIELIHGLGLIPRRLSPTDRGPFEATVLTMPMPDQLAAFTHDGRGYLILAEEGDTRGEIGAGGASSLADVARVSWLSREGRLDPRVFSESALGDGELGRLFVLPDMGESDQAGKISRLVVPGSRSVSIYDMASMTRVGDSGAVLETVTLALTNDRSRSNHRGPEPEGVVATRLGDRPIAIVSVERPGAIVLFDLTDPSSPRLAGVYQSSWDGDLGPEGLALIGPTEDGAGVIFAACFEGSGTLVIYEIRAAAP